jgi:hypothetical protein
MSTLSKKQLTERVERLETELRQLRAAVSVLHSLMPKYPPPMPTYPPYEVTCCTEAKVEAKQAGHAS